MMRKIFAAATCLVAVFAVPAATAAPKVTMVLRPSTLSVLYGKSVTLSGRVYGRHGSVPVQILAWRYGHSAPQKVATVHTDRKGRFSVRVKPRVQTKYLARDTVTVEKAVTVRVEPALTIKELGDGRISAHVAAGKSFANRVVELEQLKGGAWHVVQKAKLSGSSRATFMPRATSQRLRLALSVNQAGAGYLGGTSHAIAYRAYALTLQPRDFQVLYGHSTTLSGRLWNGRAGESIVVREWLYGASSPRTLATVRTGAHGTWSIKVSPLEQTTYQAMWGTLHASARERVGVAPVVSLSRLTGHRVMTHVTVGRRMAGRTVKLQRLVSPGVWRTVEQASLNKSGSAVFAVSLPASTLRVALSVNEAGPGYLAGFSRSIRYRP
jgi:hypothetical protein